MLGSYNPYTSSLKPLIPQTAAISTFLQLKKKELEEEGMSEAAVYTLAGSSSGNASVLYSGGALMSAIFSHVTSYGSCENRLSSQHV
jgi:hypothetical protein